MKALALLQTTLTLLEVLFRFIVAIYRIRHSRRHARVYSTQVLVFVCPTQFVGICVYVMNLRMMCGAYLKTLSDC